MSDYLPKLPDFLHERQIIARTADYDPVVNDMSTRIDNLENAIQDLMQNGIDGPVPS